MMATLESQTKLLRALAVTIDPKFKLPDDPEGNRGADSTDDGLKASLEAEMESEEPLDETRGWWIRSERFNLYFLHSAKCPG